MERKFNPYLAYSASAGSGKTFALSVRYISLLFLGVEPNVILTATFTNKAVSEMRHRVINSLINLKENPIFLEAISQETGLTHEELLKRQPQVLENFLSSNHFIVTLDSFFTSILRSASLYVGIEPDFTTKEIDFEYKEKLFLDEVEFNSELSSLVKLIMDIEDRRFLKLFDLMQNFYKIEPLLPKVEYRIDTLSYLEEQIDILRQQIFELLTELKASKTALKNFAPIEVKEFFKKSLFSKTSLLHHRNYKKIVEKNPKLETLYQELRGRLKGWADTKEQIVLHNLFKLFEYYKNANILSAKSLGILSFDDLSFFTYQLLYKSIDKEFLYFKLDSHFKHILLDEFQDTSILQFKLLKPLIDEIFDGIGQSEFRSFFYVGDTKQSLYRFRGGVEELFNGVANEYPSITVAQMNINYRSSKNIVNQVNIWFEKSMEGYFPQQSHPEASEGFVEVVESDSLVSEGIEKLKWLLKNGVNLSDITFLVSTNRDGVAVQEACYKMGYETRLKTSSSLKHLPKVARVVAMVEYLFYGLELDGMALLERVGRSFDTIDVEWFNPFMSPLEVIHRVIQDFGYFEEDLNLLKLLEFSANFSNIPLFLEEFKLSNIEVSSSSKHGVTIMTVHSSKGLEFEHVILLDRLKGNATDNSALLYSYNKSLNIDRIFYKMKGRENFDEEYGDLIEKQRELNLKDKMNVLYVALTRAVQTLIVIRKPKNSIFDMIGLSPMSIGSLNIVEKTPPQTETQSKKGREIKLTHYGTQEFEMVESENGDSEVRVKSMLFGTALHYTLEMVKEFKIDNLKEAIFATKNRYGLELTQTQLEDMEKRISKLLENHEFQTLLKGAKSVSREQSLSYGGKLKQIDLLLEYENRFLVIDYKSSKKNHFGHIFQVSEYINAIEEILKKPTDGIIIYLLEDEIELFRLD